MQSVVTNRSFRLICWELQLNSNLFSHGRFEIGSHTFQSNRNGMSSNAVDLMLHFVFIRPDFRTERALDFG